MSAALFGVDIVDVAENIFLVAVVVLQSNFNNCIIALAVKINRLGVDFNFFAVQIFNKFTNTALKMENVISAFGAFICQSDCNSAVQKRQFAQTIF